MAKKNTWVKNQWLSIGSSRSLCSLITVIGSHTGSCKLCSSSRLLHSLILDFWCFSSHKFDIGKDLVCISHKLHAQSQRHRHTGTVNVGLVTVWSIQDIRWTSFCCYSEKSRQITHGSGTFLSKQKSYAQHLEKD